MKTYENWINLVRGFEKGLDTLLLCMVKELGLKVSRVTLRERAIPCNTDQGFLFHDFLSLANEWQIDCEKLEKNSFNLNIIDQLTLVSVSFKEKQRYLLMIHKDIDFCTFINSNNSRRKIPTDVFNSFSDGNAYVFRANPEFEEDLFAEKQLAEKKAASHYEKSIREIRHFMSDDECKVLLNIASGRYKRSTVVLNKENGGRVVSDSRTSHTFVIHEQHTLLHSMRERAVNLCRMPLKNIEKVQCVRYIVGDEYGLHYDAFASGNEAGNRMYTVLIYLNDDFEGGGTWFSELDRTILPEKGKAVIFTNLENDEIQPLSRHAGLPVINGVKYASNLWIRNQAIQ